MTSTQSPASVNEAPLRRGTNDVYRPPEQSLTLRWAMRSHDSPIGAVRSVQSTGEHLPDDELTRSVDTDAVIDVLETGAAAIRDTLDSLPSGLEARVDSWCSARGFGSIESAATQEVVARQAAFLLYLKATLHEAYQQRDAVPPLSSNTRGALQTARTQADEPAFEECVLDALIWRADADDVAPIIADRHRLLASTQPAVDISEIYAALISSEDRQTLGQYRTPDAIASMMRTWAASDGDTLLDPGIGSGVLSTPAHPEWIFGPEHDRVVGIDRSPLAALMGATALTLYNHDYTIHATDLLTTSPDDLVDVDAVVCNPPYTRHHDLTSTHKIRIREQLADATGVELHRTTPLYAYFMLHVCRCLDAGDRAVFLTPAAYLNTAYGVPVKAFLRREFDIHAVVQFNCEVSVFDDADLSAVALFVEATAAESPTSPTRFVRVDDLPGENALTTAVQDDAPSDPEWGAINYVPQLELDERDNWNSWFSQQQSAVDTAELATLSDVADVMYGPSTGENDFFCLTRSDVMEWALPAGYLARLLRTPRDLDGYRFRDDDWRALRDKGQPAWVLDIRSELDCVPTVVPTEPGATTAWMPCHDMKCETGITAYLRDGLLHHDTLTERANVQNRTPWYQVPQRLPAPILIPETSSTGFKAVQNLADARHLKNMHGVYPAPDIDERGQKAILASLNSSVVQTIAERHGQSLPGGGTRWTQRTVTSLPVVDPRETRDDVIESLAACFDGLCAAARGDTTADCESVSARIDRILYTLTSEDFSEFDQ